MRSKLHDSARQMKTAIDLRLSAQRALLGNVPASLRSATIQWNQGHIEWRCIFDGDVTESDIELLQVAGTEIFSDFSDATGIDEQFPVVPYPGRMDVLEHLVFLRFEPSSTASK